MNKLPGGSVVKNSPANAGDIKDTDLISGLGRSPEKEMATRSGVLASKIPWTEQPDELPVHRVAKSGTQRSAHTHTHTHIHTPSALLVCIWGPLSCFHHLLGRCPFKNLPEVPAYFALTFVSSSPVLTTLAQ